MCCAGGAKQLFVVMRHSERLDLADRDAWFRQPDAQKWPGDGPITENGRQIARDKTGQLLQAVPNHDIDLIISSPYHRCVQTAVEAKNVLQQSKSDGADIPLIIDLGSVEYNVAPPKGTSEAIEKKLRQRRTFDEVSAFPDLEGISLANKGGFAGSQPKFWEDQITAHIRGVSRFQSWIEYGNKTGQNILVVSHQDLVHAFLAVASGAEARIQYVHYCGWGACLISRAKNWGQNKGAVPPGPSPVPTLSKLSFRLLLGEDVKVRSSASQFDEVELTSRSLVDATADIKKQIQAFEAELKTTKEQELGKNKGTQVAVGDSLEDWGPKVAPELRLARKTRNDPPPPGEEASGEAGPQEASADGRI